MKKLIALTSACMLLTGIVLAGQPNEADQKWLQVVEKKIASGQTQVSTPTTERAALLKEWAEKKGYSVQVTKTDTSYQIRVLKSVAKK